MQNKMALSKREKEQLEFIAGTLKSLVKKHNLRCELTVEDSPRQSGERKVADFVFCLFHPAAEDPGCLRVHLEKKRDV